MTMQLGCSIEAAQTQHPEATEIGENHPALIQRD
jgi:hypothetical protein